jgi:protein required for attachment to host cells
MDAWQGGGSMAESWIVVANSSRCRLFCQSKRHGPLEETADLASPASRLKDQDLYSDRPGRSFDSAGEGRHAMSRPTDAEEQLAIRFAKDIAGRLEAARNQQKLEQLVLVAEPRFLGHLRAALSKPLEGLVIAQLNKDLTEQPPDTIRRRLRDELFGR